MIPKKTPLPVWMQPGERVWIDDFINPEAYTKAVIDRLTDAKVICKQENGSAIQCLPTQLEQRSNTSLLYNDLMDVEILNDAELLQQLRKNFAQQKIYTFVGPTLIIANPYQFYPDLYTSELKQSYIQSVIDRGQNYKDLPPHLYGIVAGVIYDLKKNQVNQSILISGQSGAGKTEANKECMTLIAQYYNEGQQSLQQKVLSCNPLLQAFGNAKTIRNDNSSRFGRFVEISVRDKEIRRATITSYLLEKSRVTSQSEGERNFHIFYAFMLGCTPEQKMKYCIPDNPLSEFEYLKDTQMMNFDKDNFQEVKRSFQTLGFKHTQQMVWKILASILHIGNLRFKQSSGQETTCQIDNKNILELVSKLLGLQADSLLKALSCYHIKVGNQSLTKVFTLNEIKQIKDSLSRQLYDRLFLWLIECLNQNLGRQPKGGEPLIGLLDIYGFQVLKVNSFEQLCINFTNQRLHQLYIEEVFKGEKLIFESQGLGEHLSSIEFKDNQELIDLLDTNLLSIFNLLDEWCTVASTDETFTTNLGYYHKKSACFPATNFKAPKDTFIIRHTPRDVEYSVGSFRQKNKNLLRDDVREVLRASTISLVSGMFQEETLHDKPLNCNSNKIKRFLGSKFRSQMNELVSSLKEKSELHFIRCIKSNNTKSAGLFVPKVALEQIRYLGVLDTIKLRKNSYSVRIRYKQFGDRYPWYRYFLSGKATEDDQAAFKIVQKFFPQFSQEQVLFGNTKIFLRSYADYQLVSKYRKFVNKLKASYQVIQSTLRRNVYQKRRRETLHNRALVGTYVQAFRTQVGMFKKARAARTIQKVTRSYLKFKAIRGRREACISIQKYWKRAIENEKRKRTIVAVKSIGSYYKKYLIRKRFNLYLVVRPIAEDYLLEVTWSVMRFLNKQTIQKYLSTLRVLTDNRPKIKKLEQSIKIFESVKKSSFVEKYFQAIPSILFVERVVSAAVVVQRCWKTTIIRKKFLEMKESVSVIKKFWKEYYHKRIHSQRIFDKFFETYNQELQSYNSYCRNILFGTKRSKQDQHFYIEECLKLYSSNYKPKMTVFYYMIDFEAYVMIEDVYPEDSWIENYCRLYREGLSWNTPMQQLKSSDQTTVAATSHRLYQWGGFQGDPEKIHMVDTNQTVYSYNIDQEHLILNIKEAQTIKQNSKQAQTYKKKYVMQQLGVYEQQGQSFTQVKVQNISRFGPKQEKVIDIACGDSHVVCRTLSKKIYSWGNNKYGQLGHDSYIYVHKPKVVSFFEKMQIVEPVQMLAPRNCTVVLMSSKKIYWCGKNGTINRVSTPTEVNLSGRLVANGDLFSPLRIQASSNRTMSTIGVTFLSYNNVLDNNLTLRNKLAGIMQGKFNDNGVDLINLPFDKNLANYVTESTIRMPIYKPNIEMESRKKLRNLQQEVRQAIKEDPLDISFSKSFVQQHKMFK